METRKWDRFFFLFDTGTMAVTKRRRMVNKERWEIERDV